jgi:hypothetical protein
MEMRHDYMYYALDCILIRNAWDPNLPNPRVEMFTF